MDGNTHNSPCTHSLSQCYAVGGWSGLCGLSWISVSTLAGPHSACRRLAASAPGTGCRAARWPTSPELMPSSWRHPGWSHFMQLWLGPDSLHPPPASTPTSPSLWLPRQPQTTSLCSQCGAPLRISQCCKLYFYHKGGCGRTVFLRVLEKWEKNVCRQRCSYLHCIWICVCIFAFYPPHRPHAIHFVILLKNYN